MRIDVDLSRTHEVIEMLDLIYDSVEEGCKDRCYIKGSGADSVKWVLGLARDYLALYACLGIGLTEDNSVKDVLEMLKTKWSSMYGKATQVTEEEGDNA